MSTSELLQSYLETKLTLRHWGSFLAIFLLIFLIQSPFIHHYGSFTDQGYHLTNQDLATHMGLEYIKVSPWWWFSDIVGSWWMKLVDGFWGVNLGAIAISGITGVITALTIFQIYKPSLGIIFAIVFAGFCVPQDLVSYHSIPVLLYSIFCFYFLKLHLQPLRLDHQVMSGLVLVLLVFSRVSLILTISLPLLCLLINHFFYQNSPKVFLHAYLNLVGATVGGFALFLIFLETQGLLKAYLFPQVIPSGQHTFLALFTLMASQILMKTPYIIGTTILTCLFCFLIKGKFLSGKVGMRISIGFLAVNILFVALYVLFPQFREFKRVVFHSIWPDSFDVYPLLGCLILGCVYLLRNVLSFQETVLVLLGLAWPILRSAGSAGGFFLGIMVGFLLCVMAFVLASRVARLYECKIPLFCIGALLCLMLGGKAFKQNFESHKMGNYQVGRLDGIYTTPERAKNFRSLILEMEKHTKRGDRILACPYIPLVYYASGTFPLDNQVEFFLFGMEQFGRKLDALADMPPVLVVRPKIDFTNPELQQTKFEWPTTDLFVDDLEMKTSVFDQKILEKWKAKLVWSNDYFEIFKPEN